MQQQPSDRIPPHPAGGLLLRASRQAGGWIAVLAVTAVAIAAAETALPAVLGRAVDAAVGGGATAAWAGGCALLLSLLAACDALDDVAAGTATARSTAWLRHTMLRRLLALPPRDARLSPGDVAGRLVGNTQEAGRAGATAVRAVANVVPAAGALVALAIIDPWLCLTAAAGLPLLLVLVRVFVRDASDVAARYFEAQGGIAARLVDAVTGARTIAAAGTADREIARVLGPLPELRRQGTAMWSVQGRVAAQDALLVPLLEIAVLAVAGAELARGRIGPGSVLAAARYATLATTLSSAVPALTRLARARAAAGRVAAVLARPPVEHGTSELPRGDGRVELRGVRVRGGERPALDGVDLVVPGGALMAVVGRSGSGKSTLAAVIGRLADTDGGDVLLDSVPVRALSRLELRTQVAYGFERPALVGDTVGDAIAFGARTPTEEEVVAAARAARADGFVRRLPQGYGTPLEDSPLSGGEVQRLGLARAFAHAGRVLVLDDVAASLDTVTENHIASVLTGPLAGRTRLVVAHRASTAARADRVVWLEEGRVRKVAPHDVLWGDPDYRAVFGANGARR